MNQCSRFPDFALASLFWLLIAAGTFAADDERDKLNARFDADIAGLAAQIEKAPQSVELHSRRGDAFFFRGKFADAVADYETMVTLQPDLETSHWRKGIAYFYAKRYAEAAKQFENYHSFDNVDRENGIWRYLSQSKALGRQKAREGLLKYEKDDRQPFPDVYRLFAGELTADDVLRRIDQTSVAPEEKKKRLFYAELYVGLNEFVEGRLESAEKHLEQAVKNDWGAKAGGGPGWMWHVGRVHHDLLVNERIKREK
jgi:lipoprotein NlpI